MGSKNPSRENLRGSRVTKSRETRAKFLYLALSALVTALILWFLFTRISVGEVISFISVIDKSILPWFFVCSFASSISRTWAYWILLASSGFRTHPFYLFLIILIRNTLSDSLPARLGTLSYIALVTTRLGVSMGAATASFAVAFLFEIIALVPLLLLALFGVVFEVDISITPFLLGALVLTIISLSLILLLPRLIGGGATYAKKLSWEGAEKILLECKQDILVAKSQGVYFKVFVLSIFTRIFKYGGLYFLLVSMLRPHGLSFDVITPQKAFLGIAAAELSASLPISGIGGFGAYQGTWAAVFTLLGIPEKLSLLSSVSHHLFTQAYGYSLGALAGTILLVTGWCRRSSASDKV